MADAIAHDDAASPPEAGHASDEDLQTIAELVFPHLPLIVQAVTLTAVSKAWKEWSDGQDATERALEEAEREHLRLLDVWTSGRSSSLLFAAVGGATACLRAAM
jgi:hypothetical protein